MTESELINSLNEISEKLESWEKSYHLISKSKYNREEVEALAKIWGYTLSSFKIKSKVYYNLAKTVDGKEIKLTFNNLKEIVEFLIK